MQIGKVYISVIIALERPRQEDHELKASLSYKTSLGCLYIETLSQCTTPQTCKSKRHIERDGTDEHAILGPLWAGEGKKWDNRKLLLF